MQKTPIIYLVLGREQEFATLGTETYYKAIKIAWQDTEMNKPISKIEARN